MKGKVIEEETEVEEEEKDIDTLSNEVDELKKEIAGIKEGVPDIEPKSSGDKEEENPEAGKIVSYTKEFETFVIDNDGTRILCKDPAQAKILSLLIKKNDR